QPADKKISANKDTTAMNEMIVMNYKSNKPADTSSFAKKLKLKEGLVAKRDSPLQHQLVAQAPGVRVIPNLSQADLDKAIAQGQVPMTGANPARFNPLVKGKVISLDDGQPVK